MTVTPDRWGRIPRTYITAHRPLAFVSQPERLAELELTLGRFTGGAAGHRKAITEYLAKEKP